MASINSSSENIKQSFADASTSFSGCDMVAFVSLTLPDGQTIYAPLGMIQTLTYSTHMDKAPVRAVGNINAKDYVFGPRTIAGSLMFAVFDRHWAYKIMEEINNNSEYAQVQFLVDELLPFNITISMVNEMGVNARTALYGVRLVSEGMVVSVNDVYTENTYQFVATGLDYLSNGTRLSSSKNAGSNIVAITGGSDNQTQVVIPGQTGATGTSTAEKPETGIPPNPNTSGVVDSSDKKKKQIKVGIKYQIKLKPTSNFGKTAEKIISILKKGGDPW